LEDIVCLPESKALKRVHIRFGQSSLVLPPGTQVFTEFQKLQKLHLHGNTTVDILCHLKMLPLLTNIKLSNFKETQNVFEQVKHINSLQRLTLVDCRFNVKLNNLSEMSRLEYLSLVRCNLSWMCVTRFPVLPTTLQELCFAIPSYDCQLLIKLLQAAILNCPSLHTFRFLFSNVQLIQEDAQQLILALSGVQQLQTLSLDLVAFRLSEPLDFSCLKTLHRVHTLKLHYRAREDLDIILKLLDIHWTMPLTIFLKCKHVTRIYHKKDDAIKDVKTAMTHPCPFLATGILVL